MYECEKTTLEEIRPKAQVIVSSIELNTSAERLFELLKDSEAWPRWLDALAEVNWITPEPFGAGTIRTVLLKPGRILAEEVFYLWEENRRFSFYFSKASRPIFHALVEDYQIISKSSSKCELRWTFAVRGRGVFKPLIYLLSPLLSRKNQASLKALKNLIENT